MGILLAFIAGLFIPLTNLTVRKGIDIGGNAKGYFVFQMLFSFLFALLLGPVRNSQYVIHFPIVIFGTVAGIILAIMLFSLGKAVEKGPPGFTFAVLNSATVMPGLLMALIFGASLGFAYTFRHGLGSLLVLIGLFWGARGLQGLKEMRMWILFALIMFAFHTLLLALYQWRGMLMNSPNPEQLASFTFEEIRSEWFTPFMFLSCGIVQFLVYLRAGAKKPKRAEILYGMVGGLSNLLCTFFIIWAAEAAGPLENAVIFPIFSVVGILLTNLWGQKLYHEKVNWRACQLCVLGLFIGVADWKALSAALGF